MDPVQNPVSPVKDQTVPVKPVNDQAVPPSSPPFPTVPSPTPPTIPPISDENIPLPPNQPVESNPSLANPTSVNPVNSSSLPASVMDDLSAVRINNPTDPKITPLISETPVTPPPTPINPTPAPVPVEPPPVYESAPVITNPPQQSVYIPSQNPPPSTAFIKPKRFPFMFITIILILVLLGFGGSFLYFKIVPSKENNVVIRITPPVSIITTPSQSPSNVVLVSPTIGNPFSTPSAVAINPFISATPTFVNPFNSSSQNPFDSASKSGEASKSGYQNPFAGL